MSAEPNLNETDYELLSAYIDEMLTAEERSALETRLQNEPTLRRELTALRQTVVLVQQLPTLKAPRNFTLTPEMVESNPSAATLPASQPRAGRIIPFPAVSVLSAVASVALVVFGVAILLGGSDETSDVPQETADQSTTEITTNAVPQGGVSIAGAPTLTNEAQLNMAAGAMPEAQAEVTEDLDMAADGTVTESMADAYEAEFEAEEESAEMADDFEDDMAADAPPEPPVEAMMAEPADETDSDMGARSIPAPSPQPSVMPETFSLDEAAGDNKAATIVMPTDAVTQQEQATEIAMADDPDDATTNQTAPEAAIDDTDTSESLDGGEIDDLPDETVNDNTLAGVLVIALGVVLAIFSVAFAWRSRNAT